MNIPTRRLFLFSVLALLGAGLCVQADPVADLGSFSEFHNVDLSKLASGKILTSHGVPMHFQRGMGVQSCYVVRLPFQKAIALHKQWSPTSHPELKVYLHHDLPGKPSLTDFQGIAAAPGNSSVHALVSETEKLPSSNAALQMSVDEAKKFTKDGGSKGAMPASVASFWSNLLYQRASSFVSGGAPKEQPYNLSGETIRPSEEFAKLLDEQPKIRNEFKPILGDTGLTSSGGKLPPSLYYELFDVDGQAAFTLGASYAKPEGQTWQAVDAQYYSSGGYYVLATLYQLWPVKIGSENATLVWRADLLSSAELEDLHGVERMGSAGALMKEVQKTIGFVQKDAASRK